MIEHRHTKRVGVSEDVSIYHRGISVARCKTKDLSIEGMALWTGPLQFHRNTMLEVEFGNGNSQERLRLPAIVVYSTARVLGLMFTQTSDLTQEYLRGFMKDWAGGKGWSKANQRQRA